MKRVDVVWDDSLRFQNEWQRRREFKKLQSTRHRSVGILLAEKRRYIVVVGSIGPGTAYGGICIPRRAIRKMKLL